MTMTTDADGQSRNYDDATTVVEDGELLRRYAESGSEDSFAELVRRRIGLVYSVALRQTRHDRQRAEDATQAVFTDLARKAGALSRRPVLIGWLHRSATFAAAGLMRAENRRNVREQKAHAMEMILGNGDPETDWTAVQPIIDQALNEIEERDRDAILLRFFDGRPFAEIGRQLQLTENAARMRVERALAKLNSALGQRGITSTTAALTVALGQQATAAVPVGFAAAVTGGALTATAANTGGVMGGLIGISKVQVGMMAAAAGALVTGYVFQDRLNARLSREIAALRESPAAQSAESQRVAPASAEVEPTRRANAKVEQLTQRAAEFQKAKDESERLARIQESERSKAQYIQSEIDRMNREGNVLVEEYRALVAKAKDPSLAPDRRDEMEAAAKLKMAAIQAKQRQIKAYIESTRGAIPPQFRSPAEDAARRRAQRAGVEQTYPADTGAEKDTASHWKPADADRISLALPDADHATALSALETISGITIIRDRSIADVKGTLNALSGTYTKSDAALVLRTALRDQLNIILEPSSDGTLVARLGPPR
jgi:RNA polymerase sigma factor (sigma-70 family)